MELEGVADCVVCRKHRGEPPTPGGPIYDDELVQATHAFGLEGRGVDAYLGHLIVETKRHARWLGALHAEEGAAVGRIVPALARALVRGVGAEWVYTATIGTGVRHFHLHLLPRYPGTPPEVRWHEVNEWVGARKGGPDEIAATVERIRSRLRF